MDKRQPFRYHGSCQCQGSACRRVPVLLKHLIYRFMENSDYIFGIHSAIEAIEAGRTVDKLLIKKDLNGELAIGLIHLAKDYGIPVQRVPVEKLNRITRKNHRGVIGFMSAVAYYSLEDILPAMFEDGVLPFLLVLDGITDVRNFER